MTSKEILTILRFDFQSWGGGGQSHTSEDRARSGGGPTLEDQISGGGRGGHTAKSWVIFILNLESHGGAHTRGLYSPGGKGGGATSKSNIPANSKLWYIRKGLRT